MASEQLAAVCQLLANGEAPRQLSAYLAGAGLVALEKEDGGLRPIAMGEVFRRLTGKLLCDHVKARARQTLWPLQTGCCSPLGAEATIHAVRQWTERNAQASDKVLLKLDFANAFNTLDRAAVLRAVRAHFPELERWARWTYETPSNLRFGKHRLASQAGVQQGDPLGPLFFSLAVHSVLEELATDRAGPESVLLGRRFSSWPCSSGRERASNSTAPLPSSRLELEPPPPPTASSSSSSSGGD